MTIYWPNSHPPAKTKGHKGTRARLHGFTLVEVTLALGICSFCLVAVIGLMPIGINTNRNTLEETAAAAVAREVVADFWGISSTAVAAGTTTQTLRYQIPLPGATTAASALPAATLFLAEDGTDQHGITGARYRVDIAYGARANTSQPAPLRVLVTWPAAANPATGSWPTNVSGGYQAVTVLNTY